MRGVLFSSLFRTLLCLIFSIISIVIVPGQCQNDQCELLLQLKDELKYSPYSSTKLVTWNKSMDCCQWGGITCVNGTIVTGLDLSRESISGGINNSSSLFGLRNLRSLSLALNDFCYCLIPSSFGNLTNLIHLNLSSSGFTGQIPKEISHLKGLVTLDISSSYLNGLKLENPNLNAFVRNFSNLSKLYLDGVKISAEGDGWCQALSASLPKLEVLSLSECNLAGPLDSSLLRLQSLSIIRLDNNYLSTKFPEFLADFSKLTYLQINFSGLYGTFPLKIFQVQTLQSLDISNNPFLTGSLPEFPLNGSLQSLLLINTGLWGKLPHSIGNLKMLSRLELKGSNFSGPIPISLAKLPRLAYMDFSLNKFGGEIPDEIGELKTLNILDLSHNTFKGQIPTSLGNLHQLEFLDLSSNNLNGNIPTELTRLSNLSILDLSYNQLEGKIPTGSRFMSFTGASFEGNPGLCGTPLDMGCSPKTGKETDGKSSHQPSLQRLPKSEEETDWMIIFVVLGYVVGLGIVILPPVYWTKWRKTYFTLIDSITYKIFPQLDPVNTSREAVIPFRM